MSDLFFEAIMLPIYISNIYRTTHIELTYMLLNIHLEEILKGFFSGYNSL